MRFNKRLCIVITKIILYIMIITTNIITLITIINYYNQLELTNIDFIKYVFCLIFCIYNLIDNVNIIFKTIKYYNITRENILLNNIV
jgi:hypothetical protein